MAGCGRAKLLDMDLPSHLSGPDCSCPCVGPSMLPRRNQYDTDDLPQFLPACLSRYVLHTFGNNSRRTTPPRMPYLRRQIVFKRTTSRDISWFGIVTGSSRCCTKHAGLASTPRLGNENPIKIGLVGTFFCLGPTRYVKASKGNRSYRVARTCTAKRELARPRGERYMPPGFSLVSHDTWLRLFSAFLLPVGARLWYKARDGLWWSGQIGAHQGGSYIVRLFDDPGPTNSSFARGVVSYRFNRGVWIAVFGKASFAPFGRHQHPDSASC